MSLLQNIVVGALKNSLGADNNSRQNPQNQQGLGDLLGGLMGNQSPQSQQGLGGLLGSLTNSKGGNDLGGLLGQVLGGQTRSNPADLGSILGQYWAVKAVVAVLINKPCFWRYCLWCCLPFKKTAVCQVF